ncbi:MAG: HlyD family secretion protein [Coxiellaceae bacterium]|nr:HlyD family secretion protein [Coxiellaceae bacterium]
MRRLSAKAIFGLCFGVLLILFIVYYIWADRVTPSTNDAYVEAHVVQIAPRVAGRVTVVAVRNNQRVKQGQLLFKLNDEVFVHAVNDRKAKLKQAQELVQQYQAQLKAAQATVKKAQANQVYAEKEYNAYQTLVKENAVSILKGQQILNRYRDSQQAVRNANQHMLNIKRVLEQQNGQYAQVAAAKALYNQAMQNYNDAEVYAPFDGRVVFLRVSPGMYAKEATPVMALIDERRFWVIARIKENNLSRVKPGQLVDVSPELYPNYIMKGTVKSIGYGVNLYETVPPVWMPHIPPTRNWVRLAQRFPVEIDIKQQPDYPLRVGGTVLVTIYTEKSGFLRWASSVRQRIESWMQYFY